MPLRLKSLELQGYKTFASKTTFEFAEGITAIVGPNGSGKSNIADSLRWVLGEQSYGLLRAKKTEDMIFSGSEGRPRAGMASATVAFDNGNNWLPVDFSEVALTRRAYRDGHNEYLLNGQHVRLRDINELLAQSGLSERTYTILGQGLVDASLALKADERRRLFEEAAGIGLYRSRREEALRRLDTTQRNLERVLDILAELEPRLKSLERQARRAKDFQQVQADLRLLLLEWYGYHWHHAQQELAEVRAVAQAQEIRLNEARENYQKSLVGFTESRTRLSDLRARLNAWNRESAQRLVQREAVSRELAVLDERRRASNESRQNVVAERERMIAEHQVELERLAEAEAEVSRLQSELEEAKTQESNVRAQLSERQTARDKVEERSQAKHQSLSDITVQMAQGQARLDELTSRIKNQKTKLETDDQSIEKALPAVRQVESKLVAAQSAREHAEYAIRQAEQSLTTARDHSEALEAMRRQRLDERSAKSTEQIRLAAQLEVLNQAEKSFTGYADGARFLLEATREARLTGPQNALSAMLDVPADFEVAIAAALGEALDAVVFASGQDVEAALSLLESDSAGRATLLPLDWLRPPKAIKPPRHAACLGVAADLVKVPDILRPVVLLLLGHTLIVRERSSARRLLKDSGAHYVVTLKGEVFRSDGFIQAGKEGRPGSLGRPRQRREIQEALDVIQLALTDLNQTVDQLTADCVSAQKEVTVAEQGLQEARLRLDEVQAAERDANLAAESARRQYEWQVAQKESLHAEVGQAETEREEIERNLKELERQIAEAHDEIRIVNAELAALDLDEYQSQVMFWNTRAQIADQAAAEAGKRCDERRQVTDRLEAQAETLFKRVNEIDESLKSLESEKSSLGEQEKKLNDQLERLRASIEPAEKELEGAERHEAALQEQEAAAQYSMQLVERQNTQAQLDLTRKEEGIENLRRKIEDDFGLVQFEYEVPMTGAVPLPLGDMVETLPVVTELTMGLEESLTHKKGQLRRMGAINMEAQQEYSSTLERFNYLSAQVEDLREAETDLRQVIAELDELTKREFTKTFEQVAGHFREIFVRLFGGGAAKLVLTDPDDLTETGIDIEARLPGRREQGLALLSGGERSLTAIALVFALLKVSPTPVCVMDEVDAMLDEANVGRFRDMLVELSSETQFVIITHNRNTVQAADVIYGITMGRDSTSQLISLKLDEITDEMMQGR
jgi:chromosome segregation protein